MKDVSSRGSLDTTCISPISADLMLRRWAFRANWTLLLLRILPILPGFLQGVAGAESSSAEATVVELGIGSGLDSGPDSLGI